MAERLNGAYVDMNLPKVALAAGRNLPESPYVSSIRLERVLGDSGGSSMVYRGYDTNAPRRSSVAVKVARTTNPGQFDREIEVHSAVSGKSPHILEFLDHGIGHLQDGTDRQFMVLEYAPDGSIADQLKRQSGLHAEQALRYTTQTAEGLHIVHDAGWVHGDVKPHNALRNEGFVKLADFGIARRTRTAEQLTGSPLYMAPEQADPYGAVDPRTDVRGLAVMTFEMLQGFPLFDKSTSNKQQLDLLVDSEEYDKFVNATVHKLGSIGYSAFESPIRKAVSRDKDQRHPTTLAFAKEMHERLQEIDEGVKEQPVTVFTKSMNRPDLVATLDPQSTDRIELVSTQPGC